MCVCVCEGGVSGVVAVPGGEVTAGDWDVCSPWLGMRLHVCVLGQAAGSKALRWSCLPASSPQCPMPALADALSCPAPGVLLAASPCR